MAPGFLARYRILQKLTRAMHDSGVRLLVGTDAMNTGVIPGFSAHDEMAELVAAGLTPFEALRAATANAAEFLNGTAGRARTAGTVAIGQTADVVLLDANPLADIANTRRIAGVAIGGHWLSSAAINSMLGGIFSR